MNNEPITGGEALARMLAAHMVGPMFGMGGFQLLPFYDAIRRLGLVHHLINDERCGIFAADAYAKVTGRVGVCDATLGPGATNLITGMVEALNAGSPLVVIVGDSNREHSWKNMTQECRQVEILAPAAKEIIRVEAIQRIPALVRRAFAVATSGRPGPVVLDVPEDIAHGVFAFPEGELCADPRNGAAPSLRMRPSGDSVARAVEKLAAARRPLILAGGGVHLSGAAKTLQSFAEAQSIPVAHTMTGKGAIACTHALSAGLFGRYDRIANDLIAESDCLLVIGCKLGEIATKRYSLIPADTPLVHLDILSDEFTRVVTPTVSMWADAREGIIDLHAALEDHAERLRAERAGYIEDVATGMASWREQVHARLTSDEVPINMARLMHELNNAMPAKSWLVADGGFAAHWGGLLYDTKRPGRGFVPDRGFASIGYGLPGAIGATLGATLGATPGATLGATPGATLGATPGAVAAPVVAITGDAGFNMTLGELETARRIGLAFTLVVVNNAASGYVKALQHLMYGQGGYQSSDLHEVNYARVAEALGCVGIRVEEPEELAPALESGFERRDRPTIIDVVVTRDPAKMLPGVDNRTAKLEKGDRVA